MSDKMGHQQRSGNDSSSSAAVEASDTRGASRSPPESKASGSAGGKKLGSNNNAASNSTASMAAAYSSLVHDLGSLLPGAALSGAPLRSKGMGVVFGYGNSAGGGGGGSTLDGCDDVILDIDADVELDVDASDYKQLRKELLPSSSHLDHYARALNCVMRAGVAAATAGGSGNSALDPAAGGIGGLVDAKMNDEMFNEEFHKVLQESARSFALKKRRRDPAADPEGRSANDDDLLCSAVASGIAGWCPSGVDTLSATADAGAADCAVMNFLKIMQRAEGQCSRDVANANGGGQHYEASLPEKAECLRALCAAGCRRPGTAGQNGEAGGLTDSFASNMASLLAGLNLASVGGGARGGKVVPGDGSAMADAAATAAPPPPDSMLMADAMRAMSDLHEAMRCSDAGDDLTVLQEDFRLRAMRLSTLSSSTRDELTSATIEYGDSPAEAMAASLPPLSAVDANCAKLSHRLGEASAVAASMLWSYVESKHSGNDHSTAQLLGRQTEEARLHLTRLLNRLHHQELHKLSKNRIQLLVQCLGVKLTDADDVYNAISAVGAILFFSTLQLPLLLKICEDYEIPTSDEATMDKHLLPEALAEKISAHMHPLRDGSRLSLSHLPFVPRLQVHEHAPGSYTCTIDNASSMGRMPGEVLTSNRFSCTKIKLRAMLTSQLGQLSLFVWHRHTSSLSIHMLVRTSEPKKKKGKATTNTNTITTNNKNGAKSTQPEAERELDELRASSTLFLEKEVSAEPGELVGLSSFLDLDVAVNSPTTSQHGLRTYSRIDDRIVFQLSLNLALSDGTLLGSAGGQSRNLTATPLAANNNNNAQKTPTTANATSNASFANGHAESAVVDENAEELKRLEAAMTEMIRKEEVERREHEDAFTTGYRSMQNEEYRAAQKAQQKVRDRERKALLAKVGPTPEMIKELERLVQVVQNNRQLVNKLNKEKTKEDKEMEKVQSKIVHNKDVLAKLEETMKNNQQSLATLEQKLSVAQARIADKKKRALRREQKRSSQGKWSDLKRVFENTTSHHDTLAIDDFDSFLTVTQGAQAQQQQQQHVSPSTLNIFSTSPGPAATSVLGGGGLHFATQLQGSSSSAAAAQSASSMGDGMMAGIIGGAGRTADPFFFSTRQNAGSASSAMFSTATTPVPTSSAAPVFSTQPKLRTPADMPSPSAMSTNSGGGGSTAGSAPAQDVGMFGFAMNGQPGGNSPPPGASSGGSNAAAAAGPSSSGGLHFSTAAPTPFSTNPAAVFSHLDANAQPFSPSTSAMMVASSPRNNASQQQQQQQQQQGASPSSQQQQQFAFTVTANPGASVNTRTTSIFQGTAGVPGFNMNSPMTAALSSPQGGAQSPLFGAAGSDHQADNNNLTFGSPHPWN